MGGQRALSAEQAVLPSADWLEQAACRSVDPELFFDKGQETTAQAAVDKLGSANAQRRAEAKRVCAHCPVQQECREHFIEEGHGVYGGLDKDERKALRNARGILARSDADSDLVGHEAFDLFIKGESLVALARRYGLRTSQLRVHLDTYLRSPAGLRAQLEHQIQEAYDEGLTEEETAFKLGIPIAKVTYIRRKLGLVRRTVSQQPASLGDDRWDSSVNVLGAMMCANYLGESEDGWLFMHIKFPQASTRKWMRAEDVRLGKSVRRHVIAKGVGSGKKHQRTAGDSA